MLKKSLKFIFSRVFLFSLLIIIQILFVLFLILYLSHSASVIYIFLTLLSAVLVIWLFTREVNPAYKLIWALLMLTLPLFGGIFYLIVDSRKIHRRVERKLSCCTQTCNRLLSQDDAIRKSMLQLDGRLARQSEYIYNTARAPAYENTQAEYFELGERYYESLLVQLKKAERFIFLEYFIVDDGQMWDGVFEILAQKAAQGVDVRLIYDDLGTIMLLPKGFDSKIRAAGIQLAVFNPLRPGLYPIMNYRDHRKICVIDGNVGYTGGINLADEYINAIDKYGHWKDTGVLIQGSAVWSLTCIFLQMWSFVTDTLPEYELYRPTIRCESDGYVQPYADSPLDTLNVSENAYINMIMRAEKYVYITTPYLILDNEMTTALCVAAQSGVDVRIVTPYHPDKKLVHCVTQSYYKVLLKAGVRIYEYTPGFMHAKMFVCDDDVAIVGTANMDYRSLYMHFECCIAFYYASTVLKVKKDIVRTLRESREITPQQLELTPRYKRLVQLLLRIIAPLM